MVSDTADACRLDTVLLGNAPKKGQRRSLISGLRTGRRSLLLKTQWTLKCVSHGEILSRVTTYNNII